MTAKGYCERCGSTRNLQWCHIFSRRYSHTRHDLRNCYCGCAKCHDDQHHGDGKAFYEWVISKIGLDTYEELNRLRQIIDKGENKVDFEERFKELTRLKEVGAK